MNSAVCDALLPNCGLKSVTKSFLEPVAGLGKLGNMSVWFPRVMPEERGGHGGSGAGVVKKI